MNILFNSAPKGQKANSPGHRPGDKDLIRFALKGQKPYLVFHAFALTGRRMHTTINPGRCPGLGADWPFRPLLFNLRNLNNIERLW